MNRRSTFLPSSIFKSRAFLRRPLRGVSAATAAMAVLFGSPVARAANNTGDAVKTGATDLGNNTTTTYTAVATATSDVQFLAATTYTSPLALSTALAIGTLDDLNATAITINGTALLTLSTAANSTAGSNGADLLFVGTGANLTINDTAGITFGVSGNVDSVGTLSLGTSPITFATGTTQTFTGAGSTTVGGVIGATTGALAVNKAGGVLTLSGLNLYTGATSVNAGTLNLNFSANAAPTMATNIIKSGNTINLGGGTLVVTGGGAGATNTQTFGTTALTANTGSFITTNLNGGTALTLALGGITRNAQTALDITFSTGTGAVTTSTAQAPSNGILVNSGNVAYATANGGTSFVAKATGTSPYALSALPDASYATGAANYTTNNNVDVANGDAVSGVTVNTLRFNAANDALTLTGTNVVNTGGVLATPTGTGSTISGGTLTAGTGGHELVLHDYGSLNVSSTIADNGAATAVTLAGTSLTTLSGANTYTGPTSISGTGGLRLGSANAVQNSTLVFSPNAATSGLSFASGIGTFNVGGLTGSSNGANLLTLTDVGGTGVNLQVGNNNVSSTLNSSGINGTTGSVLTKIGTGTLTLNGGNNITVPVVVNNGTVFSSGVVPLANVPSLTINNGGVVSYQRGSVGIASGAATDTVTVNSGGIISSDYSAVNGSADTAIGAITLNGGTVATRNQPTTGTAIIYDRGTFGLGTASGTVAGTAAVIAGGGTNPTSTISAVNVGLRETGGTVFNVAAGSGAGGSASATGGVDLLFSGTVLSRSNSNNTTLIKQGNGVMALTGANSFITPVQVSAGILQINSIANGGVQTTTSGATASGSNSVTVTSATGIAAGQAVGFSSSANTINAGTIVGSGYTAGSTTVPLAIPTNATDTGTTGALVSGLALTFGTANPLGISTPVASNLIIDGGTLQYVGAAGSTDRLFQVGTTTAGGTASIDASGTGALSFTNTGALTYGTAAQARNLVLTGTNTGANTFAPVIGNNTTATTSLSKTGAGSWTLTGNNTYTGTTTVSGGILTATGTGANKALGGTTSILVNNGGTLLLGAANQVNAAAPITLGTTAAQTPTSTTGILRVAAGASQGTAETLTGGTAAGGPTTAGLGALTLNNTSTLAFNGAATTLVFNGFNPNGNVLTITGYTNTGTMTPGNSGAGSDDRLVFLGDQSANFADFNLGSGAGVGVGEIALDNGYFEIAAVPEPSTWIGGVFLLGAMAWQYRRQTRRTLS